MGTRHSGLHGYAISRAFAGAGLNTKGFMHIGLGTSDNHRRFCISR